MDHDSIARILRKELGEKLSEGVQMRNYTTMGVGGGADFFYEVDLIDDLIKIIKVCIGQKIPYLVLGGGSGVVFSDSGFPGLVIHNMTTNMAFVGDKSQVIVDSGSIFACLITEAATHGLGGLEYWFGLPGTIGGAVHNNAETLGHSISEIVKKIAIIYESNDGEPTIESVSGEWMNYGYRTSRLKEWRNRMKPVILTITLQLQQQRRDEIIRRMQECRQGRWDVGLPKGVASAGSFFKNPGGAAHKDGTKLSSEDSAGWLLEQIGAKRMKRGKTSVLSQWPNMIVNNEGGATASDVREFAEDLKQKVKDGFNIILEEEVEYLGMWPMRGDK